MCYLQLVEISSNSEVSFSFSISAGLLVISVTSSSLFYSEKKERSCFKNEK